MSIINRESVLAKKDLVREKVSVPEWGGDVFVREVTALERDQYELAQSKAARAFENVPTYKKDPRNLPPRNVRGALVALACCDEEGKAIFKIEDAAELGEKSAAVVNRLFEVAARLAGITAKDEEELVGESQDPIAS